MHRTPHARRLSIMAAALSLGVTAGAAHHAAAAGPAVTLTASGPAQAAPGAPLSYTLRLSNPGNTPITSGVNLQIDLPDSATDLALAPSFGFACTLGSTPGYPIRVGCRYVPALAPGESSAQIVLATAPATPGAITMLATAAADTGQNPAFSAAAVTTDVQALVVKRPGRHLVPVSAAPSGPGNAADAVGPLQPGANVSPVNLPGLLATTPADLSVQASAEAFRLRAPVAASQRYALFLTSIVRNDGGTATPAALLDSTNFNTVHPLDWDRFVCHGNGVMNTSGGCDPNPGFITADCQGTTTGQTCLLPGLAPGESVSYRLGFFACQPHTLVVFSVQLDAAHALTESDTANNSATASTTAV